MTIGAKDYLGDSVYAEMVCGMIRLTTENGLGASNTIYLEPSVFAALVRYVERQRILDEQVALANEVIAEIIEEERAELAFNSKDGRDAPQA